MPAGARGTFLNSTNGRISSICWASIPYRSLPTLKVVGGIDRFLTSAVEHVLQSPCHLVELVDREVGLAQRFDGLLRRLAQLRQRLADLLRPGRLRLHAFVDRLEARAPAPAPAG